MANMNALVIWTENKNTKFSLVWTNVKPCFSFLTQTLLVIAWQIQAASPYSPPKLILDEDDKS